MAQATQTHAVPVLSQEDVLTKLRTTVHPAAAQQYFALYSSILGGVVTDPALMVIPFDDHMVHRGHAVFDTAAIVNGMMYQLEAHLNRFERSASMARIPLPFPRTRCATSSWRPLGPAGSAMLRCATGRRWARAALAWHRASASVARSTS